MGKQLKQKQRKQSKIKLEDIKKEEKEQIKKQQVIENNKKQKIQKQKNKNKRHRIIIRNLIFDINQKHIRKLFAPYGQISQIQVPKDPNNQKLNKGFAFVQFSSLRSCEKAIKQLNKTIYKGRPIVIDFSVAKVRYMTNKIQQQDKQQQKIDNQQHQQKEEENQQQQQQQQIKEQKPINRQPQDLSRTVFLRNVPSSATQQGILQMFSRHGRIKWVRLVVDKKTGTHKGTAFMKFMQSQVAKKLIEYSRSYEMFLQGKLPRFKSDPSINLQIDGTILKLFPVETKDNIAQKLKERQQQQADKKPIKLKPLKKIKKLKDLIAYDKGGKRRLALAQCGVWQANENMSEQDQQRFKGHSRQKIQKLKNPNNIVSDKRIILKYLDKNITQQRIKQTVRQFLSFNKMSFKELTYCKLMLDSQRKRSAGYAFIQFATHQTAYQFVQQLAQNQDILMERPFVVQFALQDSRKLAKILKKK